MGLADFGFVLDELEYVRGGFSLDKAESFVAKISESAAKEAPEHKS